ncbi:MAG: 4Fe-4S binding protein [candidate division Zixibacteria bacterium]|nr:4Fe-4S binding protein [candidate division Zixibacteria bacterium]
MLKIELAACLSCAGCIALCPEAALFLTSDSLRVNQGECTLCCLCVKFCPVTALVIDGKVRLLNSEKE